MASAIYACMTSQSKETFIAGLDGMKAKKAIQMRVSLIHAVPWQCSKAHLSHYHFGMKSYLDLVFAFVSPIPNP